MHHEPRREAEGSDGSSSPATARPARKVTATASGSLLPEGDLTVDYDAGTITIPAVDTGRRPTTATSKVEVVAISARRQDRRRESFTVAVEKMPDPPPRPVDISSAIRLVIVSLASDGTARATIKDNANPFRYEIEVNGEGDRRPPGVPGPRQEVGRGRRRIAATGSPAF